MLDTIFTRHIISVPKPIREQTKEPFYVNDLLFSPIYNDEGKITFYRGNIDNLRLHICGNYLFVKNSWHKYFKGNNYTDYFRTEIEETFYQIENAIGEKITDSKIQRIAYGCVINEDPYKNFPNWKYLKSKLPQPMHHNGKTYGVSFNFTDFKVKGYDKAFEVWKHDQTRIFGNHFRVECEVKHMRHLHDRKNPITIRTAKDLFNSDYLELLAADLLIKYRTIEKNTIMDLAGLSTHDIYVIASMKDETIREHLKREHKYTYKRNQSRFKRLKNKNEDEYFDKVEGSIEAKLSALIAG